MRDFNMFSAVLQDDAHLIIDKANPKVWLDVVNQNHMLPHKKAMHFDAGVKILGEVVEFSKHPQAVLVEEIFSRRGESPVSKPQTFVRYTVFKPEMLENKKRFLASLAKRPKYTVLKCISVSGGGYSKDVAEKLNAIMQEKTK